MIAGQVFYPPAVAFAHFPLVVIFGGLNMNITKAGNADIPSLTALVNAAYRGPSSRRGWTHEADLFEGQRMDEATLQDMMAQEGAVVFKGDYQGQLQACVYLRVEGTALYLGMLTVSPLLQAGGIGGRMLAFSEDYARRMNCGYVYMKVIDTRTELLQWYLRHGYRDTAVRIPFKGDGADLPLQPIRFAVLRKDI